MKDSFIHDTKNGFVGRIENYKTHKAIGHQILAYYDYLSELFEWACEQYRFDPFDCVIEFPNGEKLTYEQALELDE